MIPSYLKEFADHPNRVKVEDLQIGDFFVCIHNDRHGDSAYRNTSFDQVWRCSDKPKFASEYRSSVFATNVSMARHVIGLQTTFIYLWFGVDPIIIKLPKDQQIIYGLFYDAIQKNDDVHRLGWSDWRRSHKQ